MGLIFEFLNRRYINTKPNANHELRLAEITIIYNDKNKNKTINTLKILVTFIVDKVIKADTINKMEAQP